MTASFFPSLNARGVEYLLISGQATILYGAATFSEDVDIWLRPTAENLTRFVDTLRASAARYYKLTPPLTVDLLEQGHGFHFVLPSSSELETYLDVMGKPPRVGSFEAAASRACDFDTDFGSVHTIGIKDLVEVKKTQRAVDYPIIGRLALAHLQLPSTQLTEAELLWALDNTFGLTELRATVRAYRDEFRRLAPTLPEPLALGISSLVEGDDLSAESEDELDAWLETRSSPLRATDRRYWRGIIDALRELKRAGALMTEGAPV